MSFEINPAGWNQIVRSVINEHGVPMMQAVADQCNLELVKSAMARGTKRGKARTSAQSRAQHIVAIGKGYMVGIEGDDPLTKHDYRATVITASAAAMRHNAKHQTLLKYFVMARRAFVENT